MHVPEEVQALADTVQGGTPLAWHEYDDHWVITMQDGRKMHFKKPHETKAKPRKQKRAEEDAG